MEIEMKYALPDAECSDEIWNDEFLNSITNNNTAEALVMKAIYFDTEDMRLTKNKMAVRVRAEGDRIFATLKAGDKQQDGMFERHEVNVPISDSLGLMSLSPEVFEQSEEGQELIKLVEGKPLINLFEMRFLRRCKKLSYGSSVMELALDLGSIISDKGEKPICEMEIELYAGKPEDIQALGAKIAEKYGLTPKTTSKFKDGLSIGE